MKLQNSKFSSVVSTSGSRVCISHSLVQQQIYGDSRLLDVFSFFSVARSVADFQRAFAQRYSAIEGERLLAILSRDHFLVGQGQESVFDYIAPEEETRRRGYRLIRVLLTDVCNLACSYCKVMPNIVDVSSTPLSYEKMECAVRMFFQNSCAETPKIVHISGGEPLMRWNGIKRIVSLVERYRREKERYYVALGTNGILLTGDRVKYLSQHGVKVIVSMDGRAEIHDLLRRDRSGRGSHGRSVAGITLLRDADIEYGLSMVVGRHNIGCLTEEIGDLISKFAPTSLGVNFMKPPSREQRDFPYLLLPQEYVSAMYASFKKHRWTGTFFELVYRKLQPFVTRQFRYHDCGAAAGTTINLDARGRVGPCKSFLVLDELASGMQIQRMNQGTRLPIMDALQKRSPVYEVKCWSCPAISICGKGCAYEAWAESGSMMNIDSRACAYTQLFYRQFIEDLADVVSPVLAKEPFYVPSQLDRRQLFGKMVVDEDTLSSSIGHATDR